MQVKPRDRSLQVELIMYLGQKEEYINVSSREVLASSLAFFVKCKPATKLEKEKISTVLMAKSLVSHFYFVGTCTHIGAGARLKQDKVD